MDFGILGPLVIRRGDAVVDVRAPKQRAVLLRLLLEPGRAVSTDLLLEDVWAGHPPRQGLVTLRSYVSNLRNILHGDDGEPVLVTRGRGYALEVDPATIDAVRFERAVRSARAELAAGRAEEALATFESALGLWRGQALDEVADEPFARPHVIRLEELALSAHEGRFECLLRLGRHVDAVPELEAFVVNHPLREGARGLLVLALYRSGRAPDALASHREFSELLAEELGMDPTPGFARLAQLVLQQAPELNLEAPEIVPASAQVTGHFRLVGRDAEREQLLAALSAARRGRGRLVLITGPAGIGKTALLQDLAGIAKPRGVRVHWGRCPETVGSPAFWPWTQIIHSVAEEVTDDELRRLSDGPAASVSQIAGALEARLGERHVVSGGDSAAARFQLFEAVALFLRRAAEDCPLVLVVDDLHWADESSLDLLTVLAPQLASAPVLLVGSYRDLSVEHRADLGAALATLTRQEAIQEVQLGGLSRDEVAEMLGDLVGSDLSAHAALIHDRSDGNPFFVRQLARLLEATDAATGEPLLDLPPGIRHVLQHRLQSLPPPARELLDVAAILGRQFNVRHVAEVVEEETTEVLDAIDVVVSHGLLESAGPAATTYRFVHALLRETVEDMLPPGRSARLHARVATVLEHERHPPVGRIAEHLWRSADLVDDDRPMRFAIAAAQQANDLLAYEQAERQLQRALELVSRHPAGSAELELEIRLRILSLANNTQRWSDGSVLQHVEPIERLARSHGIGPDLVPLWWSLRTFFTIRGEPAAALRLSRALSGEGAHREDTAALAAGRVGAAVSLALLGDHEEALAELGRAEPELEAFSQQAGETLAAESLDLLCPSIRAMVAATAGDVAATRRAADRAVDEAVRRGTPFACAYARWTAAMALAAVGLAEAALADADAGLADCAEHRYTTLATLFIPVQAWAQARLTGDGRQHAARAAEAISWLRAVGHRHSEPQLLGLLADIHLVDAELDDARRRLLEARRAEATTGERFYDRQLTALEHAVGTTRPAAH